MPTRANRYKIIELPISSLIIDLNNPRHEPQTNKRDAIKSLFTGKDRPKMLALIGDIVERGLNPSDLPIVIPDKKSSGSYVVLEGNRRVAALLLLSNPELVRSLNFGPSLSKELNKKIDSYDGGIASISCAVVNSREEAQSWIRLKHTGENNGIGTVLWNTLARNRFAGKDSLAIQALDILDRKNLLDDTGITSRFPVSTLLRILITKEVRKLLGIEVVEGRIVEKKLTKIAAERLVMIVTDLAQKRIKEPSLHTADQRIEYVRSKFGITDKEKSGKRDSTANTQDNVDTNSQSNHGNKTSTEKKRSSTEQGGDNTNGNNGNKTSANKKRESNDKKSKKTFTRNFLVPENCTLEIGTIRIQDIFGELERLPVNGFVNSCAILLRVFLEMSVDEFFKSTGLEPKREGGRDKTLREKTREVVSYICSNNLAGISELQGINSMLSQREHPCSIDSIQGYVHNRSFHPTVENIKAAWDNMQPFMVAMWAETMRKINGTTTT